LWQWPVGVAGYVNPTEYGTGDLDIEADLIE
jgi:hypothetical protein